MALKDPQISNNSTECFHFDSRSNPGNRKLNDLNLI